VEHSSSSNRIGSERQYKAALSEREKENEQQQPHILSAIPAANQPASRPYYDTLTSSHRIASHLNH